MKLKATSTGSDFVAPAGSKSAVCVRALDQGTQDGGQWGPKRKLLLAFEIEDRIDAPDSDWHGRRYLVFANYTMSMHVKAQLRKHLESWRGRAYQEDEEVDLSKLLGRPALISITHSEDGKWANISSIGPLAKGMEALKPEGDLIMFDCDNPDIGELEKLGENMQNKIKSSPEYRKAMGQSPGAGTYKSEGDPPPPAADLDDDIPF